MNTTERNVGGSDGEARPSSRIVLSSTLPAAPTAFALSARASRSERSLYVTSQWD